MEDFMKIVIGLILTFISAQALAAKIGIIDMQKVINSIKEGKSVIGTLEKSFNEKKAKLKKEEDKIIKAKEEFQKQSMVLSDQAKVKKEQELQQMIVGIQQKTVEYQKEIQGLEQSLKKPLLDKLKPIVDEVSKKEGVDLTFEISSPVIYAKDKVDLTDAIIKAYDAKHKK